VVTTHLVFFSFLNGASVGDVVVTPPAPVVVQSGVKNKRRKWAVRRNDKYYYFEDLRKLEAFVREADKAEIIIPREIQRKAKVTIKKVSGVGAFDIFDSIRKKSEWDDEADIEFILLND
jgi:hypothetical protein